MNIYLLNNNNQPIGPYSIENIRQWLQTKQIESTRLACPEGGTQWVPAHSLASFISEPQHLVFMIEKSKGKGSNPSTLWNYYKKCWTIKKLFGRENDRGRSTRKEYFAFVLFQIVITVFLVGLFFAFASILDNIPNGTANSLIFGIVCGAFIIYFLFALLAFLGIAIRRLHDIGYSGKLLLFVIVVNSLLSEISIPTALLAKAIGFVVHVVLFAVDGSKGANKYGPDPKVR